MRVPSRIPWTPTGAGVFAAATALYLAGARLGYPELRRVALGLAGLLALATLLVLRRPRLTIDRVAEPARLTAGTSTLAHLTATNRSPLPTSSLLFVDRLGAVTIPTHTAPIAPRGRRDVYYLVDAPRRGRFALGPLTVERHDPFGLARLTQSVPATAADLWVRPRVHPMTPLPAVAVLDDDQHASALPHGSRASASTRRYVAGDDPRHMHWRLTARTGTLIVREREEARQPALTVLLDTRADLWDEDRFDAAAEVAASAVLANQAGVHPAELVIPGQEDGSSADAAGSLDRLAAAVPSTDIGVEALVLAAERGGGGSLMLITGRADAGGLVTRLAGLRRHYATVVVIEIVAGQQPAVARPRAGLLVLRAPDAARAVAAWNTLPGAG